MWTHKESLFSMLSFLDHLGFIQRSLAHTQIEVCGLLILCSGNLFNMVFLLDHLVFPC